MVDKVKIIIRSGKGGDGIVHFRRAKFMPKGGPDGGDGGRGGSVYIQTDANLSTLSDFAHRQLFAADEGKPGGPEVMSGAAADDLTIKVPVGTLVSLKSSKTGEVTKLDFDKEGMNVLIAKGGRGGRGNYQFRSSTNQAPREFKPGGAAIEFEAVLELRLLADVGLIGLPNAGKSTLLSILTSARPKIANYPFTTLEPNLGVFDFGREKSMVIADIPGLIEGASEGKGLGVQFLQHVERTRLLVHLLSADESDIWKDYLTVRQELAKYGQGTAEKKELVVLNKIDLLSESEVGMIVDLFKEKGVELYTISCGTMEGIDRLKKKMVELI